MDAALQQWIADRTASLGSGLVAALGSPLARCLLVFFLGGVCGRAFDCVSQDAERPKRIKLVAVKAQELPETEECTVCLDFLSPKSGCGCGLPCVRLPCGHLYHTECIEKWLSRDKRQSCPVCRMDAAATQTGLRRRIFWPGSK